MAVDPGNIQALETAINIARYKKDNDLIKEVFDKAPTSGLAAKNADVIAEMLGSDSGRSSWYPDVATIYSK